MVPCCTAGENGCSRYYLKARATICQILLASAKKPERKQLQALPISIARSKRSPAAATACDAMPCTSPLCEREAGSTAVATPSRQQRSLAAAAAAAADRRRRSPPQIAAPVRSSAPAAGLLVPEVRGAPLGSRTLGRPAAPPTRPHQLGRVRDAVGSQSQTLESSSRSPPKRRTRAN